MACECCPTCGQLLPPEIPPDLLSNMQARVFDILSRAGSIGVSSEALFERLYAEDENGGPDSGKSSMYVIIKLTNDKLKPYGIRIVAPGSGRHTHKNYRLAKV